MTISAALRPGMPNGAAAGPVRNDTMPSFTSGPAAAGCCRHAGDPCCLEAAVRPDPIDERQPRPDLVACDVEHLALFVERARGDFGRVRVDGDGRDAIGRRDVA